MGNASGGEGPLVIGHRGSSGNAPENTLAAVRLAMEQGADGVEVDLRLTRDGRIVLMHDANTFRSTGRYHRVGRDSLERLRGLKVGRGRKYRLMRERIPTLDQVLETLPPDAPLMLEMKAGEELLVPLKELLDGMPERRGSLYLLDFRPWMLEAAREIFPAECLMWNVAFEQPGRGGAWSPEPRTLVPAARDLGVRGLNLMVCDAVDRDLVLTAHDAGLDVHVWTVNEPDHALHLAGLGVEGIITDYPGRIRTALEEAR
ncbi:MAG: glycerophosphodiester phosphodiesterase family protein [bacterium]